MPLGLRRSLGMLADMVVLKGDQGWVAGEDARATAGLETGATDGGTLLSVFGVN